MFIGALNRTVVFPNRNSEPLTQPSATLSPSDGERDGVRGISEFIFGNRDNSPIHPSRAAALATGLIQKGSFVGLDQGVGVFLPRRQRRARAVVGCLVVAEPVLLGGLLGAGASRAV